MEGSRGRCGGRGEREGAVRGREQEAACLEQTLVATVHEHPWHGVGGPAPGPPTLGAGRTRWRGGLEGRKLMSAWWMGLER